MKPETELTPKQKPPLAKLLSMLVAARVRINHIGANINSSRGDILAADDAKGTLTEAIDFIYQEPALQAVNHHAELLQHLRILSAEDSQCEPDWLQKKQAARAALAKLE